MHSDGKVGKAARNINLSLRYYRVIAVLAERNLVVVLAAIGVALSAAQIKHLGKRLIAYLYREVIRIVNFGIEVQPRVRRVSKALEVESIGALGRSSEEAVLGEYLVRLHSVILVYVIVSVKIIDKAVRIALFKKVVKMHHAIDICGVVCLIGTTSEFFE